MRGKGLGIGRSESKTCFRMCWANNCSFSHEISKKNRMFHKSTLGKQKQNQWRGCDRKVNITNKALEIILTMTKDTCSLEEKL